MNDGRAKVSERRRRFIDEYIICGNAAEAARRAGYSERTARVTAAELMARADIREAINMRLDELHSRRTAKASECIEFLSSVMRGEVEDTAVTPSGKPIKISARVVDRIRAAELLLKVYGEFKSPKAVEEPKQDFTKIFTETLCKICGDSPDGESA